MTVYDEFVTTKNSLENVTAVVQHFREEDDQWASLTNVENTIEYLKEWLETEANSIDVEERQKLARVILFLKNDKDSGVPSPQEPHERIPDDVQEELETLHGAMTIYTAKLWAEQKQELRPEEDNMFY